jgi:hypothetical protein
MRAMVTCQRLNGSYNTGSSQSKLSWARELQIASGRPSGLARTNDLSRVDKPGRVVAGRCCCLRGVRRTAERQVVIRLGSLSGLARDSGFGQR